VKINHLDVQFLNLRLGELSSGLTVIYGGEKSGKTTIARFFEQILFGFTGSYDYLASKVGKSTGALGVDTAWGYYRFERGVGQSRHNELTVHPQPNDCTPGEWMRRILGGVTAAEFADVFTFEFNEANGLDRLAAHAVSHGTGGMTESQREALARATRQLEQDDARRADISARLSTLNDRRVRLQAEIDDLQRIIHDRRENEITRRRRCEEEVARLERQESEIHAALSDIDTEIARLEREAAEYEQRRRDHEIAEQASATMRFIDSCLVKLRTAESDCEAHISALRNDHEVGNRHHREALFTGAHDYADTLRLEAGEIDRRFETLRRWENVSLETRAPVESQLAEIQREMLQLAGDVGHTELELAQQSLERDIAVGEGRRREIGRQIAILSQQREELQRVYDSVSALFRQYQLSIDEYRQRLADLRRRREETVVSLRNCQAELAAARQRLHEFSGDAIAEMHRLDVASQELEDLDREWRRLKDEQSQIPSREELLRKIESLRVAPRENHILDDASRLLQRLSDGELRHIGARENSNELWVEDHKGVVCAPDLLSVTGRDQVKLSLVMALANDFGRRHVRLPLVLDDALQNFATETRRAAVDLLREYCTDGGQVLLLTGHRDVAHLLKSLGDRVVHLPSREVDYVRRAPTRVSRLWDCEEFPGELRDYVNKTQYVKKEIDPGLFARRDVEPVEYIPRNVVRNEHVRNDYVSRSANSYVPPVRLAPPVPAPLPPAQPVTFRAPTVTPVPKKQDARDEVAGAVRREIRLEDGHYLSSGQSVSAIPFLEIAEATHLQDLGVHTVGDLMNANATELAVRMVQPGIRESTIRRWQAMSRMMCDVRGLRAYDSRILYACGITTSQQLRQMRPNDLYAIVEAFVATPEGSRLVRSGSELEMSRIDKWISNSNETTPRVSTSTRTALSGESERSQRKNKRGSRSSSAKRSKSSRFSSSNGTSSSTESEFRFYLEENSDVEAAPTIGPKQAERLYAIGIHTVADLLNCDVETTAEQLDQRRVKGKTVLTWQRQASMVCRVPNLRGHDAQILVACGVHEPTELASSNPETLFGKVAPFCKTKEGQRYVRGGKTPDLEEVKDWIRFAQHTRGLAMV